MKSLQNDIADLKNINNHLNQVLIDKEKINVKNILMID